MKTQEKRPEPCILRIEGYASDGAGISHLEDGRVIFVKGALSGELCRVSILKMGKSAAWGQVEQVLEASKERVTPDCPYYPACGGCQLRHMSYQEELRFKHDRVQEALRRIGGTEIPLSCLHPAQQTERYRNKLQFPLSPSEQGPRIGFFRSRSHEVIDVNDCLLQPQEGSRMRAALKAWMLQFGVSAYDERRHEGYIRHLYVRTNHLGQSLCVLVVNGKKLPHEIELIDCLIKAEPGLIGIALSINRNKTNVILGHSMRNLWGETALDETLCGLHFHLSPQSFFQVNRAQTELLYQRALAFAALSGQETVLDLYCGIGTITLAMAQQAKRVIGAEVVPEAVEDARANAERNGIKQAEFLCADAGEAAKHLAKQGEHPDVICVDPPRKGLSPDVIETIATMQPDRIVYVSCDPATLGRDIKLFEKHGYAPKLAEACDLFPRTVHVETIVLFTRS